MNSVPSMLAVSKARLIITAVVLEGRTQAEVARDYKVSKAWVSTLVARYHTEGEAAFEPRSRRPKTSPATTKAATVELIISLRRQLSDQGLDAGSDTIAWHLEHHHKIRVSTSTIHRVLRAAALVTPAPNKRPKSSYIRFAAEQPNECWQSDFTHYRLRSNTDVEIITWLDDHARFALSVTAHSRITGPIVVNTFRTAVEQHGIPASTLTDNGLVFTTRLAGGRGGRNAFEAELVALGVHQKNSRPNHPTPAAKSNASSRPSKHGSGPNPSPTPSPSSKPSSTPSSPSTTSTVRTAHSSTERLPPPPTRPARKPRPAISNPTPTNASAKTASTPPARSPSGSTDASTTSASAASTPEPPSSYSSKTSTSASSTPPPARSSDNSPSTPPRTTRAPEPPRAQPDPKTENGPTFEGSVRSVSLARSHSALGGIRTPNLLIRRDLLTISQMFLYL